MKPPIPLYDPRFKYVNAASTDLEKTFARIKREQEKAKASVEQPSNVKPIKQRSKTA